MRFLNETHEEHLSSWNRLRNDLSAVCYAIAMKSGAGLRGQFSGVSRLFKRRPKLGPQPIPRHDKDIPVRYTGGDLQIPVDGSEAKRGFIVFIDEDRRRSQGFQQLLCGEILRTDWVNPPCERRSDRRRQALFD